MLTWLKIALRNVLNNRRRSVFTILAVGFGFAAVNIFGGFTEYVFVSLRDGFVYMQGSGHLTVFKKGFLAEGKLDPERYLIGEAEARAITQAVQRYPEFVLVTPQLHISGMLSNGQVSTVFVAEGFVPSDRKQIRAHATGTITKIKQYIGRPLEDAMPYGVALSSGLAELLKLGLESNAIVMSPTVDGQINALDVQVVSFFESPFEPLNDKFMRVPLSVAQPLYDTKSVDRISILLSSAEHTEPVQAKLKKALADEQLDMDIRTWEELSPFYTKAKNMLDVIFLLMFLIVFTIAAMSVINTISMAVLERTREIGTLRALGTKRRDIVLLFAMESGLLGIFGALLGVLLVLINWVAVRLLEPTWIPPQITRRIPFEVYLVPEYMLWSMVLLVLLSVAAAVLPARRAARQPIVGALGHV